MPDAADDICEHFVRFSQWEVRRTLADEKSQFRRIVKPQPGRRSDPTYNDEKGRWEWFDGPEDGRPTPTAVTCPYGQPGDVLWVREAFRLGEYNDDLSPSKYVWGRQTAGHPIKVKYEADGRVRNADSDYEWGCKRPSTHMPRELCRLRLRVEDVRVGRVQDVDNRTALAEGQMLSGGQMPRDKFAKLWAEMHGFGSWKRNEWVWVIEFSCIEGETA